MTSGFIRPMLYGALLLLFLLHNDLWLWTDDRRLLGLPVGLTYHVVFCLASMVLMALLVKHAWPRVLTSEDGD